MLDRFKVCYQCSCRNEMILIDSIESPIKSLIQCDNCINGEWNLISKKLVADDHEVSKR